MIKAFALVTLLLTGSALAQPHPGFGGPPGFHPPPPQFGGPGLGFRPLPPIFIPPPPVFVPPPVYYPPPSVQPWVCDQFGNCWRT